MSPKRDYWLWFSHLILCVAVTWKPPQGVLNRRDQHSHLPEIVQAFTVNPPMPYETRRRTTPQRSRGYKKRSIRPSFGNRNEIAKPLNWQQPPAPVVRLWESLQLFFFFSLLKRRPLFLSYNLQRSHVLMVLKPSPPRVLLSVSLLNSALVTFFRGYNTSLWQDFCHVPRPKKVLFFVFVLRSLGGEKRSRSIGHQHHRHRSLTWTWTPTITCTHLYIYIFIYICTHAQPRVEPCQSFSISQRRNRKHTEIEQWTDGARLGWEPHSAAWTPLANWVRGSWILLLALWPEKKSAKTRQTPTAMSEFASVHFWKCVCEKKKVIGVWFIQDHKIKRSGVFPPRKPISAR